ncbi:MAG: thiol oxidoreductase-like protein [Verrucomicrobia bacterium]|nr:thiol oxidoreductase-like protein [Verrucomicrobiota bacterium]MBT5479097.1 thiol oxidoreductase-like protein [Verrucomicrobiota bacterium]MBT6237747.1 thiol oxidoreductase-like protein [Verrucomicrobiota bacterium]MBT7875046.1 thiol oxidoreductase-like protein [Verrucomicrobiota bacterium]
MMTLKAKIILCSALAGSFVGAKAQLVDESQVGSTVLSGAITESLAEQVGAGRGHVKMPLSSKYLIKRDPARAVRRGRQLFQRKFTATQGLGPRVTADSVGDITANPALGAGISDSCAGCHGRPKGAAGFGGVVTTRPDSRDAPHLFGLGLQEMIADEMTWSLRSQQAKLVEQASQTGTSVSAVLTAKGVHFGTLSVDSNGNLDTSQLEGLDADLRVKPFFAQGSSFSMRDFIVGAFKDEMGLQAYDPDLATAAAGGIVTTPSGMILDGQADSFAAPAALGPSHDQDADGVVDEVDPALVDFMEFYLLNYFKPGIGKQTARTEEGLVKMNQIGCTSCHVQNFTVDFDRRLADVETVFDPVNGKLNRLYATATTRWMMVEDGEEYPLTLPQGKSFEVENIFTDFKRHDLGDAFHERHFDGAVATQMITEPLWGVGSTAPYGHDGRSINLTEVILRHGGEAQEQADAFAALSDDEQRKVIEFLQTLILFPPDDTASNLNPGSDEGSLQDPAIHGNINLGAIFQIPDLGQLPSTLKISPGKRGPNFKWYGSGGNTYELQGSRDFKTWKEIDKMKISTGGVLQFKPNTKNGHQYYRVRHSRESK